LSWWINSLVETCGGDFSAIFGTGWVGFPTKEDWKDHLKVTLGFTYTQKINGKDVLRVEKTSKMTKKRFSELYDSANQFGINVLDSQAPHPEWDYRK
jgi:hypothetical protein